MAQSDMNIANQGFPAFRADLNAALAALVSNSSGATAPSATFPHQFWVDTAASPSVLKQRNLANDAWVTIGSINEATGVFTLDPASVDAYTKDQTYTKAEVDAFAVKLTGNQTVAGVKTFSSDPVMGVSALTGDIAAARITNALNASGSAPIYACRAWVNFNGTGTVAIRASGNVSSITDNGPGVYTINFTNAMLDANYAVNVSAGEGIDSVRYVGSSARAVPTTTAFQIQIVSSGGFDTDTAYCYASIFR